MHLTAVTGQQQISWHYPCHYEANAMGFLNVHCVWRCAYLAQCLHGTCARLHHMAYIPFMGAAQGTGSMKGQ